MFERQNLSTYLLFLPNQSKLFQSASRRVTKRETGQLMEWWISVKEKFLNNRLPKGWNKNKIPLRRRRFWKLTRRKFLQQIELIERNKKRKQFINGCTVLFVLCKVVNERIYYKNKSNIFSFWQWQVHFTYKKHKSTAS